MGWVYSSSCTCGCHISWCISKVSKEYWCRSNGFSFISLYVCSWSVIVMSSMDVVYFLVVLGIGRPFRPDGVLEGRSVESHTRVSDDLSCALVVSASLKEFIRQYIMLFLLVLERCSFARLRFLLLIFQIWKRHSPLDFPCRISFSFARGGQWKNYLNHCLVFNTSLSFDFFTFNFATKILTEILVSCAISFLLLSELSY